MEVYSMGKTATLNIRVNPDVKENAESVLAQLGIPMATAIDMYLKQISLVGGIPFSVVLPKAANSVQSLSLLQTDNCLRMQRQVM